MSGRVVISPDIKKTSVRIDIAGNEIDPKTKKIIKRVDEGQYTPPPPGPQEEKSSPKKTGSLGEKIKQMIEERVNEVVEQKIEEVLKEIL